jgi:hypothetical protein
MSRHITYCNGLYQVLYVFTSCQSTTSLKYVSNVTETQPIYSFPATIATYTATPLDVAPADASECRISYRTYGQKDDENDEEEDAASQPMQLPCGHVFGSECLKVMVDWGFITCSYCAARMKMTSGFVHRCRYWVADWWLFQHWVNASRQIGNAPADWPDRPTILLKLHTCIDENHPRKYEQELFARRLTVSYAWDMWFQYCKLYIIITAMVYIQISVPMHLAWVILDWICKAYFEVSLLNSLKIVPGSYGITNDWAVVTVANFMLLLTMVAGGRHFISTTLHMLVFWFFLARFMHLLLGVLGVLALEVALFVAFASVLGVLISYGVKQRTK